MAELVSRLRDIAAEFGDDTADGMFLLGVALVVEAHAVALRPFATLARQYDARIFPPDSDDQGISTTLGDCRRALQALAQADVTGDL